MPDPAVPATPLPADVAALPERFRTTLARLTQAGQSLTAAFSGGLDSTVLLHLLAHSAPALGLQLKAAHVNHRLQAEADAWAAHCQQVAAALGVPLSVLEVNVDRASGKGIEAAARAARHAALRGLGGDALVLAHHRGDQAETLLHRLVRGSGVHGAAAMREADPRGGPPRLLRPLLGETRACLRAWAEHAQLSWIEDPSNADTQLSRNFLRHAVLAPLNQRFPGAEASLARAAQHFDEAAGLLDELALRDFEAVARARGASHAALLTLSDARLKHLLRARLAQLGYPAPDTVQLHEALRLLREAAAPWRACFGDWALCADGGTVWFEQREAPSPGPDCLWHGEAMLQWGGVCLRFRRETGPGALALRPGALQIKPRQGGERIQPEARRPARDIKTLARDAAIPPWWRSATPVLWQDGRAVAWGHIADHRLASRSDGWHIAIEYPNAKF